MDEKGANQNIYSTIKPLDAVKYIISKVGLMGAKSIHYKDPEVESLVDSLVVYGD